MANVLIKKVMTNDAMWHGLLVFSQEITTNMHKNITSSRDGLTPLAPNTASQNNEPYNKCIC